MADIRTKASLAGKIMKRIRIALLDDHAIVRHGLANHLATVPLFDLVGIFGTSRELISGLLTTPVDLLLLDFALSPNELDGVSLIRAIRVKFPDCRILVLSAHHDPSTVSLALRVGARGFVGKNEPLADLIKAIHAVASGTVYLNADMSYSVAEATTQPNIEPDDQYSNALQAASLSAREQEVIRCYLAGMTVSEIAEKFNRSIKTISTQKSAAFRKLGVTSNNGLFKIKETLSST
jgi:DNA-binding NarL/FixJ family response regulator